MQFLKREIEISLGPYPYKYKTAIFNYKMLLNINFYIECLAFA